MDPLFVLPSSKFLHFFLHVTLGLVSYCTKIFFQTVEYCMATSSTAC